MTFEASNGLKVIWDGYDRVIDIDSPLEVTALRDDEVEALREYFLAEQAEELGWFVSKKHPNIVAKRDLENLNVVDLFTLDSTSFRTDCPVDPEYGPLYEVAQEFLDAGKPPHPLESARPGEVWVIDGVRYFIYVYVSGATYGISRDAEVKDIEDLIAEGAEAWKAE